jgi:glutamyl-Q tRNA(Asp) synthetase
LAFVTRFAPSPSGHLHLGHAFSAVCAWQAARKADGRFLLRIEDIDTQRCKAEFETSIQDDLIWLGLDWEEPVRRQSEHLDDYTSTLNRLRAMDLVYRCFKTRREILDDIARAPHAPGEGPAHSIYRGPDRMLSADEEAARVEAGEAFAWRLSLKRCRDYLGPRYEQMRFEEVDRGALVADPVALGDVVMARKDLGTSYHLAVVHDDALQGMTHIVRGQDLFEMTPLHVLLQTLLNLPIPTYRHHRLLLDDDGKRYAKRNKAATLKSIRETGGSAEQVRALIDD